MKVDIHKLLMDRKSFLVIGFIFIMGVYLLTGAKVKTTDKTSVISANENNINSELEEILSRVYGAGRVKVLINYSQSGEKILAYDMESNTNEKEGEKGNEAKSQVVYDGNKMPVIIKEYMPKVEGVIIVAEGGDNENVKKQLISGCMALLGIDEHKIEVLKMK